jgi:NifB/MoaA-like Fe-S oxidoreductase
MVRVARVRRGSIGSDVAIPVGTSLLSINGRALRDSLDLQFYEADADVLLEARLPDGQSIVYEIEKPPEESLGLVPEPDTVRRCTNACAFCFVKGNPRAQKLRQPLYVKDDDYRLSFMFGHYVTLTNLRDEDWVRISEQRLTPLYVSVHATDGRIGVHAQVVLCPDINNGAVLERTISDLYARDDDVLSLAIVPVGLTSYNADRGIRQLTQAECAETLSQVDAARERALVERERAWCYAADELFLQAGRDLPQPGYYDGHELVANGVGAVSTMEAAVRGDLSELPRMSGRNIVLVTGTSMGPHLRKLAQEMEHSTGARVEATDVENTLYGPMVTTAGLLSGRDHLHALTPYSHFDLALFSRTALNDRDLFLDDLSLSELRESLPELEVCPSEHVTDTLLAL